MSEERGPILVGSIIHLENGLPNGGYLDARGLVADMPVISKFQDYRIRKFVSTHSSNSRSVGSGSWLVLSAGKPPKLVDTPLTVGDEIHLLNMNPGSGYLDTFEHVPLLIPFADYGMKYGVFTTGTAKRDDGLTGTWTVRSAVGKRDGEELVEHDEIYLENAYGNSNSLAIYRDTLVTDHPLFGTYDGQLRFVFTSDEENEQDESRTWTLTLSNLSEDLYRVQSQWGDEWHEEGLFKIGDAQDGSIIALSCELDDQGDTLFGTVTYVATDKEEPSKKKEFQAIPRSENVYDIKIGESESPTKWLPRGQWLLGTRKHQKIIAMAIDSNNDGRILSGTVMYEGEGPMNFRFIQESRASSEVSDLLNDALHPEWVKGRAAKMESDIVANYRLLSDLFQESSPTPIEEVLQHIYQNNSGKTVEEYDRLKALWTKMELGKTQNSFGTLDHDFQIEQLLNLHQLSNLLNACSRYTLYELMKESLVEHRNDKDESVAPLHLFRRCFEHVATDHEIIRQAIAQRRQNRDLENNFLSAHPVELLITDKLAIKAVAPFQHLLLDHKNGQDDLAIITYLSERTHIHLVPYTKQFILIGVSYDRVPPAASIFDDEEFIGKNLYAFELMAIPHEVGHYVFQHGKVDGRTFSELSEKFEGNPYYRWCEEIFADVYSCIVAGPLAAISMQALLMSIDKERAWKDDEEHPTPVLRIFIFAEILYRLKQIKGERYPFENVVNKLDSDWSRILALWGYGSVEQSEGRPVRVYLHDNSGLHLDQIVNVKRVMKAIQPIVLDYVEILLQQLNEEDDGDNKEGTLSTEIPWTRYDKEETGLYNVEMGRIVNLSFANQKVPWQLLLDIQTDEAQTDLSNPDEKLRQYLKKWGDRGPHGWGEH